MKLFIGVIVVMGLGFVGQRAHAQTKNRMDLDDLMIKGEIHNDDRLMILAREKNQLKNYVKFRTSYKEEILEELPPMKHKQAF